MRALVAATEGSAAARAVLLSHVADVLQLQPAVYGGGVDAVQGGGGGGGGPAQHGDSWGEGEGDGTLRLPRAAVQKLIEIAQQVGRCRGQGKVLTWL